MFKIVYIYIYIYKLPYIALVAVMYDLICTSELYKNPND